MYVNRALGTDGRKDALEWATFIVFFSCIKIVLSTYTFQFIKILSINHKPITMFLAFS